MLRIFAAGLCATIVSTAANAQQYITNFNKATVFRSMQCEIGLFAAEAKGKGLNPAARAHVKYTTNGSVQNKVGAEAGFNFGSIFQGPKLSADYDFTKIDSSTLEGKLNINQGNTATCLGKKKPYPAIPMGIRDCLKEGLEAMANGFITSCTRKVNAKATFNASGKFIAWVITIGPSVSGEVVVSYQIDVDAPAKEDKS